MDHYSYLQVSQFFLGLYMTIEGIEWMLLISTPEYKGFFSKIALFLRLQDRGLLHSSFKFDLSKSSTKTMKLVPSVALLLSIFGILLVITAVVNRTYWPLILSALLAKIAYNSIIGFGFEGADQMSSIVLIALTVHAIVPQSEHIIQFFVMTQLILAYVVSGVAKLVSRYWLNGSALIMVMSTHSFGVGNAKWLVKNKQISQFICILVIIFEIAWFALPLSPQIAMGLMVAGFLFHLLNALLMGLNLFVWSFAAAYPWALEAVLHFHKFDNNIYPHF